MEGLIAVIPARAGSVRLPRKNMLMLGGKPMIEWTIEAACRCGIFKPHQIIISTNMIEAADLGYKHGCVVTWQPEFTQNDDASRQVLLHAFFSIYTNSPQARPQWVMLLQPTSPLRDATHIRRAWAMFEKKSNADSLVSVGPDESPNGAIYITSAERLAKGKPIYDHTSILFPMSVVASIDIDTQSDLDRARWVIDARG